MKRNIFASTLLALVATLFALGVPALAQTTEATASEAATMAMPARTASVVRISAAVYAAYGEVAGKKTAVLKQDGSHLGDEQMISGNGVQYVFPDGNIITLKFTLKRTELNKVWFHVELPPVPAFTVPGGPWARGSQIVIEGDIWGDCTSPLESAFDKWLRLGDPDGLEIGWLDLSERGTGPGGQDGLFRISGLYLPKPYAEWAAKDGMSIRSGDLEVYESPGGERYAILSAVRIIDPVRHTDLRLAAVVFSLHCTSCR